MNACDEYTGQSALDILHCGYSRLYVYVTVWDTEGPAHVILESKGVDHIATT